MGVMIDLMFRVKGTVILKIWKQIILLMVWTVGLLSIHNFVENYNINFPQTLIPVLGVVTGMLLAFRTNTAYDRYYEGRKIWSSISLHIRNLTRCFWIMTKEKDNPGRELVQKISGINLLVAFVYSTKNYIRGHYSYSEVDYQELINHLPKYATMKKSENNEERPCSGLKFMKRGSKTYNDFKAYDLVAPTNIPIEITHHIASFIKHLQEEGLVENSTVSVMNTGLSGLVDNIGGLERILRTPMPLAYSVHLHHALWIYLLALPFQLIGIMNWWTVAAVGLASFTLLGMLSIGWEIENPFGDDANDLPVDDFCQSIHSEILRMTMSPKKPPVDWVFCDDNQPCMPVSRMTAEELTQLEEVEVEKILRDRCDIILGKMGVTGLSDLSGCMLNGGVDVVGDIGNVHPPLVES